MQRSKARNNLVISPPTPSFLIAGFPKAGSTSLWEYLRSHPAVYMSNPKEPQFFNLDENYDKGWSWYLSKYADARDHLAIGEASVHYSMIRCYPQAPLRIARHLPDAKLIFTVRHPLRRIESQWRHMLTNGNLRESEFNRSVLTSERLVGPSHYWEVLQSYRDLYDDARIHLVFFEELISTPSRVLSECFQFLGVDSRQYQADLRIHANPTDSKRMESPWLRRFRQLPGIGIAKNMVPRSVRRSAFRRWGKVAPPKATWSRDTLEQVCRSLRSDTARFLEFAGKPLDYWDLNWELEE